MTSASANEESAGGSIVNQRRLILSSRLPSVGLLSIAEFLSLKELSRATAVCKLWRRTLVCGGTTIDRSWAERLWKEAFGTRWPAALADSAGMKRIAFPSAAADVVPTVLNLTWQQRCSRRAGIDQNWESGRCQVNSLLAGCVPLGLDGEHVAVLCADEDRTQIMQLWPCQRLISPPLTRSFDCAFMGSNIVIVDKVTPRSVLSIWSITTGECLSSLRDKEDGEGDILWGKIDSLATNSCVAPKLWAATEFGYYQFDVETGQLCSQLLDDDHIDPRYDLHLQNYTLLGQSHESFEAFDVRSNELVHKWDSGEMSAWSFDGNLLLVGCRDIGQATLWDLRYLKNAFGSFSNVKHAKMAGGRIALLHTHEFVLIPRQLAMHQASIYRAQRASMPCQLAMHQPSVYRAQRALLDTGLGGHRLFIYDANRGGQDNPPKVTIPVSRGTQRHGLLMDTERVLGDFGVLDFAIL